MKTTLRRLHLWWLRRAIRRLEARIDAERARVRRSHTRPTLYLVS